jgi:undecaprenyl phosphate N,N'-diacetylbacillosamine 1-phosphate transferase
MYKKYFKRILDIIVTFVLIMALSPFILIVAIINAIIIRGNPFFFQERVGEGLKIYKIIKFRTMIPTSKKINSETWSHGDVEFTAIGELLRRWSIDELPALWNVLLGQMSLIGPRPLLKSHVSEYRQSDYARHNIRPGITGLAQINGRNSLTWEERYDYDLMYVSTYNFKLDIFIILKTVSVVFRHYGHNPNGDPKRADKNAQ